MSLICERGKPYEYRDDTTGERFFSVTQVRTVMWDGFNKVPYHVLEEARIRGDALHVYFALRLGSLVGACERPDPLPQYDGYCRAIEAWIARDRPVPMAIEETSCNRKLGIAGTRDADVQIGRQYDIVDLKTGAETPTDAVQLLAYHSMEGTERVTHLYDLRVYDDGTFDFEEVLPIKHQADWACFLNSLQVLKWRASR